MDIIRRVDPELIPPPVASEQGRQIETRRRPKDQPQSKQSRGQSGHSPPQQTEGESDAALADTVTYDTEGHVQKCEVVETTPHSFDTFA